MKGYSSSMPLKGTGELTDHLSVAVSPAMKRKVEAAAKGQGVRPAVVARWAIEDWLNNNGVTEQPDDSTGAGE